MTSITSFLSQLELSQTEITIYLTLFKTGPLNISKLSSQIKTPRTTTFENCEKLINKGLISHISSKNNKLLKAESPTRVELLIAKQKVEVNTQKQKINQLEQGLPQFLRSAIQFKSNSNTNRDISNITIVSGKENVYNQIIKDILKAELVYSFTNLDKMISIYPDTLKTWINIYKKIPHRQFWDITLDTPQTRMNLSRKSKIKIQYYAKLLPKDNQFFNSEISTHMMYNNKVALFQFEPNNVKGFLLESPILYESFVGLHKTMWDFLPDPQI